MKIEITGRYPPVAAGDGRGAGFSCLRRGDCSPGAGTVRAEDVAERVPRDASAGNGPGGVCSRRRPGAFLSRTGFRA